MPPATTEDHIRGQGREAIVYMDLACPHCATAWAAIGQMPLRLVFRHFPVASKHPRAPALHAAAEAAALQGGERAFWAFVDSLYADQGHIDDPHLWERARALGLEIERFDADRRAESTAERVRRDFESGIRAGIAGTPGIFVDGRPVAGDLTSDLA